MVTLTIVSDSKYYTELNNSAGHGIEYYSELGKSSGFWQGKLAEEQGLIGKEVTRQDMEKIQHLSKSERLGLDITYSASKSVSLAYSLLGDERIKQAHEEAVKKANEYLEKNLIYTRQGAGGKEHVQASGVAIANFSHFTSRENDPQLHTHSVVLNSVIRSTDGKITALEPRTIFEHQKAIDQIYKNELASRLQEMGYKIEMVDKHGNFEIVGFSQELLDKFSERKGQVLETAQKLKDSLNIDNEYKIRDIAAIESRQSKEFLSKEELNQIWDEKLRELGITREDIKQSVEQAKEQVKELSEKKALEQAKEYLNQAWNIIHENESAFTKTKLFEVALRQSMSNAIKGEKVMIVDDMEKAFQELVREKEIIRLKNSDLYTTKYMQKIEKEVIDFVKKSNDTEKAFVNDKTLIDNAIKEYEKEKGFSLTQSQRGAVYHILQSQDKVIGIQGDAGVGKTTSIEIVARELEKQGYTVRGLAPTGKASELLQKEGKIQAQTVDSFLQSFEKNQIIKDMDKYIKEYEKLNQKFENRSWKAWGMLDKKETFESQIKNMVRSEMKAMFGIKDTQKGGWGYEYKDRAYIIEKDGWKAQMVVEYGQRLGVHNEINVYLRDTQTGKITHTRFVPVTNNLSIKEMTKEYQSPDKVIQYGKEVWVVDEASMISSKEMHSLMQRAKEANARVVVMGDVKQLRAVEAGKIFEDMQKNGMKTIQMTEKVRQKDIEYKETVKAFSEKDFAKTIEKLEASGKVHEIKNREENLKAIKEEYLKGDYKKTLIVTAINRNKNELNHAIREELKAQGKISQEGFVFVVKESKNLSAEEKRYSFSYNIGDSVHISRNDMKEMGITSKTNEFWVKEVNHRNNTITISNNKKDFTVDLQKDGDKLSVYSQKQIEISKGDKIMTLKNDRQHGVKNGETWIVKDVDKNGNITIKNDNKEKTFNIKEYNYIDHAYASTVHKSQGMTTEKVIYECSRKTNYNEMYTAMTRGKQEYSIYTNDKQQMYESMKKIQEKTSTIESSCEIKSKSAQAQTKEQAASMEQSQAMARGR